MPTGVGQKAVEACVSRTGHTEQRFVNIGNLKGYTTLLSTARSSDETLPFSKIGDTLAVCNFILHVVLALI